MILSHLPKITVLKAIYTYFIKTFFIKNETEIISKDQIRSFNIKTKELDEISGFLPEKDEYKIIITSGASCPDSAVDKVMQKIMNIFGTPLSKSDSDS